jgi:hypothetical protein
MKEANPSEEDKKPYSPNLTFYGFGTLLGIITVTIFLAGYPVLITLKEPNYYWLSVVLMLGVLAGVITILAIIANMFREE